MIKPSLNPFLNQFSKFQTVGQWNSHIREAVSNGYNKKAFMIYCQMKQSGSAPNKLTFPFVAKACAKSSDLMQSQIIHADIMKSPFRLDVFVGTALVDMYVKCRYLYSAQRVLEEMPERDVTVWNALLLGFAQSSFVDRFFILFREMRLQGFSPDSITLIGLTQTVIELKDLHSLRVSHALGIRLGIMNDISLANTLISCYGKCGDLRSAVGIFDATNFELRTIVSWNSLIAGHALFSSYCSTFSLYQLLLCDELKPDVSTFLSLLSSCTQPDALPCGKLIHSHAIQLGCDYDVTVSNTLLTMYSRCGDMDSAWHLFLVMPYKTCVSWTAVISGYAEKGNLEEAFNLLMAMQMEGEKPDVVTLVSLLSGCGQTGSLELGRWLDNYALSNGLRDNVLLCNAIIDMYAKCGSVDKCKEVFNSMPSRSIISWTTMISGLSLNGKFTEALDLFFTMVELGLNPNHITFLTILQACSHAGFLDEGWECFELMTSVYKLNPWLEHFSCMVNLLGRKGKLKEALDLIKSMPFRPDAAIWGALLGACKIHCNLEIGEYAAYQLYGLEPEAAVSYVELANMYASVGKWDGVSKVRALMKCKDVRKTPGQSIIQMNQINGKNHKFTVEEICHPEGLQIYKVLDVLALQLKENPLSCVFEGFSELELDAISYS